MKGKLILRISNCKLLGTSGVINFYTW